MSDRIEIERQQEQPAEFGDELRDEALDRPARESVPFTPGATHAG